MEAGLTVKLPQAKEHLGLQEAGSDKEVSSPRGREGAWPPDTMISDS